MKTSTPHPDSPEDILEQTSRGKMKKSSEDTAIKQLSKRGE